MREQAASDEPVAAAISASAKAGLAIGGSWRRAAGRLGSVCAIRHLKVFDLHQGICEDNCKICALPPTTTRLWLRFVSVQPRRSREDRCPRRPGLRAPCEPPRLAADSRLRRVQRGFGLGHFRGMVAQIGPHTADYWRQPATTWIAASSLRSAYFVVVRCLELLCGTAFDSRWRYQKSPYPVRVFRAFCGRECLNSNGRLTEFGRRSSAHDLPERLRRLGIAVAVDRDVAIVRDADVTVAQPLRDNLDRYPALASNGACVSRRS